MDEKTYKKTLLQLVKKEANSLLKKATRDELQKLNFSKLNPNDQTSCIYGQMTGNCFSRRASVLIYNCTEKSYIQTYGILESATLNGKPNLSRNQFKTGQHYSPIEVFISQKNNRTNGNNEQLISYLKRERKTLRFKNF